MTPSRSKPDRNLLASLVVIVLAALSAAGCGGGEEDLVSAAALRESAEHARGHSVPTATPVQLTPVAMHIGNVPIPVLGSDDRYHVVYEIELANHSGSSVDIERLSVLDARGSEVITALDAAQVGQRLVVRDSAAVPSRLGAAQVGLLYLHVVFDSKRAIPHALVHRLEAVVGTRPIIETAARIRLAQPTDLVLDVPLRGPRYIAGDGCCDSVRHVRATLPLNGRLFTAQRFAIDWEQLDEQGRIYVGNPKDPASYVIYGKPAYAVADARVLQAVDGLPDTPPGALPSGITLEQADGNHVVLDLGDGRYALYAHFKPGSVRVSNGQLVRRGEVLGLVGTSGNSSEPHLHFQVTDGPSPFTSNGVPYRLRSFEATRRGASTAAFDRAILDGRPLATEPVAGAAHRERVMPLDLWIVNLPE